MRLLTALKVFHAANRVRALGPIRVLLYKPPPMAKRKSISTAIQGSATTTVPILPPPFDDDPAPPSKRRASQRRAQQPNPDTGSTNPDKNANVLDAPEALRASPDGDETMNLKEAGMDIEKQVKNDDSDSLLSELEDVEEPVEKTMDKVKGRGNGKKVTATKNAAKGDSKNPAVALKDKKSVTAEPQFLDPEAEGDEEADEEEIQAALSRPPPVNSDYLPLPWKGRLGYVNFAYIVAFSISILIVSRLAYVHISAFRILPCSALEHVALRLY